MRTIQMLAALALTLTLAACGGGDDPAAGTTGTTGGTAGGTSGGTAGGGTGGGSSADGPTLDSALLAQLCPVYDAPSKTYSHCKATSDANVNGLLVDVNTWIAAHSPTKTVAASPAPDASYGVVAADACSFALEPGLGLWMMTLKNASGPSVAWTGTAFDQVQLNAAGVVVYMSASTDGSGAGFIDASGQMEINFPGATGGTTMEAVYGHDSLFVNCTLK